METVVLLVILIGAVSGDSHRDRRTLLHSDVDMAQAIQSLKADSVQVKSDLIHLQGTVAQLQSQNSQLQSQNSQLQSTVSDLQSTDKVTGSSYVRWGRTSCPANGTTLAYSGYMGGGKYTDTGAAVNRLCMTADPIWDLFNDNIASVGKLYSVEYEPAGANFFGTNMQDQDALCAVCHSPRSAAMMIPGRNQCYPGWTKEYSGFLVSGDPGHVAATEYICLDGQPESIPGGARDDNENRLYLVEGVCGSLECPPYVNGRELTCVVCTK